MRAWYIGLFLLAANVTVVRAQQWHPVGKPGFSAAQAYYTSLALNFSGVPYIAYTDWAYDLKCSVMMYNGSEWVYVGNPGFSGDSAYSTHIAIDNNNTLYVCYTDYSNGQKVTVMKFNGSEWVLVGSPGISSGMASSPSMAIDHNNNIYVAYQDFGVFNDGPTVMKFNGSRWDTVGSPGFTGYEADLIKIVIDKTGTPYIILDSGAALVMKYNGSSWEYVGGTISGNDVSDDAIVIDDSGTLYVSYSYPLGATYAEKYNAADSSWELIGNGLISSSEGYNISMAVDGNATPYIVYSNDDQESHADVKKFDGTNWVYVGPTDTNGMSSGATGYNSMAIDKNNNVYVAYGEGTYGKATVMEYSYDTTGIKSIPKTGISFTVYPNPAQNIATIEWQTNPANKNAHILIYDLLGNEIIDLETNNSGQARVDVSGLAEGMYIVKLLSSGFDVGSGKLGVIR